MLSRNLVWIDKDNYIHEKDEKTAPKTLPRLQQGKPVSRHE